MHDALPVSAIQDIQDTFASAARRQNTIYRVGDATVTRIDELALDGVPPTALYPGFDPEALRRHRCKFGSGSVQFDTLRQSIHTWLVQTPRHIILIDTATGNDKDRPYAPVLDHLQQPYLARLAAAGVLPEAVDYVLLTHLHADHVGWNTRLVNGRWVPTFPNARHIFSKTERTYNEALADGRTLTGKDRPDPALGRMVATPSPGVYNDSVRPIIEAGLADVIEINGEEFIDGLSFLSTPGHSIDHASIRLLSQGQEAFFAGDVMHHPLQVYEPELTSCYCEFPEASHRSRRWVLEQAADRDALVFTTHFAESSAGRVSRADQGFAWRFV